MIVGIAVSAVVIGLVIYFAGRPSDSCSPWQNSVTSIKRAFQLAPECGSIVELRRKTNR